MEIYRRYGHAILRKCERMLGNREDAEDIVQALFTDLFKKDHTEVDLPYLYRAATNRSINFIRNRKRRGDLLTQQAGDVLYPRRTLLDDQIIDLDLLIKLVGGLDGKSLEILVYRYFDDLTLEEISDLMNLTRKTVGKRLAGIRRKVTRLAGREYGGVS